VFGDDNAAGFPDAVGGDNTPDAGGGVDIAVGPDDGAGVQDAVAADFHEVAQHGTELLEACGDLLVLALDHHQSLVGLDVGGQAAGTHVGLISQDAVAYIIIVGDLDIVEEDHVFQLY